MQIPRKTLMRLALRIHAGLVKKPPRCARITLPADTWLDAARQAALINVARRRGWNLAAARCTERLRDKLVGLNDEIAAMARDLCAGTAEQPTVSVADIFHDLMGLHDEFAALSLDFRRHTISVTTEPVTLEGVELGPFEIRLEWERLLDPDCYLVIAVDPNPANCNISVTHPHVQDNAVCEGEGRQPIRQALQQGRLLDFFLIVATLLRTYNDGSPYVKLSDWYGALCVDCSTVLGDDDRYTCDRCDSVVCEECYYACTACDRISCAECNTRCETCDQSLCTRCIESCRECLDGTCVECLDESERCKSCHEKHATQIDNATTDAGA